MMPAVRPERPVGFTPRRDSGLSGYERVLARAGLGPVAGVDEAGRGACAGPLVVAAADIDRIGLHVCNVAGMRRALAGLGHRPGYVLTDGFPVRGLTAPALAMWKGDQVAACVAAASVVAKVTRDALMRDLSEDFPDYGFARHKGYSTPAHMRALAAHGPCHEHRKSFVNVRGCRPADVEQALENEEILDPEVTEMADVTAAAGDNEDRQVSCYGPGSGQNGPIVDVVDEPGWPTAGLAVMARGA